MLSLREVSGRMSLMPQTGASATGPNENARTSWPFRNMACALSFSIILSAFVLPAPEGLEVFRDLLYVALVILFLVRWRLAVVNRERNRAWYFYFALILAAPLIIFLSEPVLKAL